MSLAPFDNLELPPEGHPLHKLGARLAELLDEDQWAACERLLLEGWAHDAIDRKTCANSRDFYKRRCEALQAVQDKMRDPERKAVCDILANGETYVYASVETSMKQFTDQSTATRMEKAKRVLRSLANGHDYRYFHGDGYPRHNDLQQDAAAALEVLEQLTKPANADVTVSRECPECGSAETEWHCAQTTNSGVVDGRLRMHDVSTVFYLGCNHCSETIRTVSGDDVAQWMNTAANAALSGPATPQEPSDRA